AFRDVYDAERYRQAQRYAQARTRFGLLTSTLDLGVVLAFWLAGGFHWLDAGGSRLGLGPIPGGLPFFGSLALARAVLALPFRWWSTFVIEERFGFNRTTPRTFCLDVLKGILLTVTLGGALLAAILWLLATVGPGAWPWCWLASAVFLVVVQLVAP